MKPPRAPSVPQWTDRVNEQVLPVTRLRLNHGSLFLFLRKWGQNSSAVLGSNSEGTLDWVPGL